MDNLIRTEPELKLIRKSGAISAAALKKVIENAKVGITLLELEKIATDEIIKLGGTSAFKTVPGYDFTTCLAVNEEVVHGIPREVKLKEGDILSIDLGAIYEGWYSDVSWSIIIGKGDQQQAKEMFLEVGEKTLWKAINQAREGNKVGDIASAIQQGVEKAGYSVVKSLAGHGVGKKLHEEPEIPEYGAPGTGMTLRSGMTLAIEVIYTSGSGKVAESGDGWTISASDKSWGGLFEMSVIVGKKKAEILTDWRTL